MRGSVGAHNPEQRESVPTPARAQRARARVCRRALRGLLSPVVPLPISFRYALCPVSLTMPYVSLLLFSRSRPALSYGTRSLSPRHCLRCGAYYYIRQLLSIIDHPAIPFVGCESRSQLSLIHAIRVFAALSFALVSERAVLRSFCLRYSLQTVLLLSHCRGHSYLSSRYYPHADSVSRAPPRGQGPRQAS